MEKVKDRFPKENRNTNHVCYLRLYVRVGLDNYKLPVADKITGITSYKKNKAFGLIKILLRR